LNKSPERDVLAKDIAKPISNDTAKLTLRSLPKNREWMVQTMQNARHIPRIFFYPIFYPNDLSKNRVSFKNVFLLMPCVTSFEAIFRNNTN